MAGRIKGNVCIKRPHVSTIEERRVYFLLTSAATSACKS